MQYLWVDANAKKLNDILCDNLALGEAWQYFCVRQIDIKFLQPISLEL